MKKLIEKYQNIHKPSFVCEIGMFRDLLGFYGFEYSYAFCFGISGSMGFAYGSGDNTRLLSPDYILPSYMASPIMPLSFGMNNLCRATNVWSKSNRTTDKEKLRSVIKEYIDEGRPIVLEVEAMQYFDMLGVPSFTIESKGATKFAIGGHVVTLIGYDDEKATYTIVEAFIRTPVELKMDEFLTCCTAEGSYVAPEGEWNVFYVPQNKMPDDYLIFNGIRTMVNQMKYPYQFGKHYYFGFAALQCFLEELTQLPNILDPYKLKISLLLFYNFERMEPTRGFFRKLYAEFLFESAEKISNHDLKLSAQHYQEIGNLWIQLAELILCMINNESDSGIRAYIESKRRIFDEIILQEKEAVNNLEKIISAW